VIGLDDRHDLALLGGVAGRLDGDVDGFGTAGPVDRVLQVARRAAGQFLGERGARQRREMVVAHVEAARGLVQHLDKFRVAMAEVVGAAVEMDVDQPAAVHVVEEIVFAPVDHQIDTHVLPGLCLARVPEGLRALEELQLFAAHSGHTPRLFPQVRPYFRNRIA
jgi:hypothetical protein